MTQREAGLARETTLSAAHILRLATREAHESVERLSSMQRLAEGDLDIADYAAVLRGHLAVVAPWERHCAGWLQAISDGDWHYRPRAPLLWTDLQALGTTPSVTDGPASLPDGGPEFRWGMLYVLEGSQLGGRIIARALRQRLPGCERALGYFEAGVHDPAEWRRFQQRLDRVLVAEQQRHAAIQGAHAMFALFERYLAVETA